FGHTEGLFRSASSLTPRELTGRVWKGRSPKTHGATLLDRAGRFRPGSYRTSRLTSFLVPLPYSEFTAIAHHLLSYSTRASRYRRRGHRSWHWHAPLRFLLLSSSLHTPQTLIGHHLLSLLGSLLPPHK